MSMTASYRRPLVRVGDKVALYTMPNDFRVKVLSVNEDYLPNVNAYQVTVQLPAGSTSAGSMLYQCLDTNLVQAPH